MWLPPKCLVAQYGDYETIDVDVVGTVEGFLDGALPGLEIDLELIDRHGLTSALSRQQVEHALERRTAKLRPLCGINTNAEIGLGWTASAPAHGTWVRIETAVQVREGSKGDYLVLADVPEWLALDGDFSVPLQLSQRLCGWREWVGLPGKWRPLCRVEGIVQRSGPVLTFWLLRLQARHPLPTAILDDKQLLDEAQNASIAARVHFSMERKMVLESAQCQFEAYRTKYPQASEQDLRREVASQVDLRDFTAAQISEFEKDVLQGPIAFWLGLVSLSPALHRISARGRRQLLSYFDDGFGPDWRAACDFLSGHVPLRLTPQRLDTLRAHIERVLGGQGSTRAAGDPR